MWKLGRPDFTSLTGTQKYRMVPYNQYKAVPGLQEDYSHENYHRLLMQCLKAQNTAFWKTNLLEQFGGHLWVVPSITHVISGQNLQVYSDDKWALNGNCTLFEEIEKSLYLTYQRVDLN